MRSHTVIPVFTVSPPSRNSHPRTHAADVLRNLHVITVRGGLVSLLGKGRAILSHDTGAAVTSAGTNPDTKSATRTSSSHSRPSPHGSLLRSGPPSGSVPQHQRDSSSTTTPGGSTMSPLDSETLPRGSTSTRSQKSLVAHDALTLLAMYLSAIIHDYDHRGVTNAFLIQDEDPLAVRGDRGDRGG